jgi:hypothetical protein
MIKARCQNGQLQLSIPGRPGEMGRVHLLTATEMLELQASIGDALVQHEAFSSTEWSGPGNSSRRGY